jgi:hypothetical protein
MAKSLKRRETGNFNVLEVIEPRTGPEIMRPGDPAIIWFIASSFMRQNGAKRRITYPID